VLFASAKPRSITWPRIFFNALASGVAIFTGGPPTVPPLGAGHDPPLVGVLDTPRPQRAIPAVLGRTLVLMQHQRLALRRGLRPWRLYWRSWPADAIGLRLGRT